MLPALLSPHKHSSVSVEMKCSLMVRVIEKSYKSVLTVLRAWICEDLKIWGRKPTHDEINMLTSSKKGVEHYHSKPVTITSRICSTVLYIGMKGKVERN